MRRTVLYAISIALAASPVLTVAQTVSNAPPAAGCKPIAQIEQRMKLIGGAPEKNIELFLMEDVGCKVKDPSKIYTAGIPSDSEGDFRLQAGPATRKDSFVATAPYRSVQHLERLAMWTKMPQKDLVILGTIFHKGEGAFWGDSPFIWFAYTTVDNIQERVAEAGH